MKKILITGGDGYIAKSLYNNLKDNYIITTISRRDFDLTDFTKTLNFFSDKYFDVVLHCAISGGSRLETDNFDVVNNNLKMFYNLLNCKNKFSRFINFGSGAEIYQTDNPYGLSKKIIHNLILKTDGFYNIRIFAVFDENEKDTRFIKSNILRYIKNQPLHLFDDKEMDFFYMKDFTRIVNYFIINDENNLPKTHDCTYNKTFRTIEILEMINNLEDKKLPIVVEGTKVTKYCGEFIDLGIDYLGLEKGIKNTYNIVKNRHD